MGVIGMKGIECFSNFNANTKFLILKGTIITGMLNRRDSNRETGTTCECGTNITQREGALVTT